MSPSKSQKSARVSKIWRLKLGSRRRAKSDHHKRPHNRPVLAGVQLAETIRYAMRRREDLERFLHDGRIELDTNIVERAIRPQTITRKNALFAGSDGGGRTWATIATLLATTKLNGVDPYAWLTLTLQRIANG